MWATVSLLLLPPAAALCRRGLVGVGRYGLGFVERVEDAGEPIEDVPGLVEVPELLVQDESRTEGSRAGEPVVHIRLDPPEVFRPPAGVESKPVFGRGPREQVLLPLGQVLGRADDDVEQLERLEPAAVPVGVRGL
jgi:hypothetical protein